MTLEKIKLTVDTNNSAVSVRDIDAILATYEPNAALVGQPGVSVIGTPALREAFKQFLAINPKITNTNYEIFQADDIALYSSTWKMSGKAPDGTVIEQNGFSVIVLRKQPDGRWLIMIDNAFADHLLQET